MLKLHNNPLQSQTLYLFSLDGSAPENGHPQDLVLTALGKNLHRVARNSVHLHYIIAASDLRFCVTAVPLLDQPFLYFSNQHC